MGQTNKTIQLKAVAETFTIIRMTILKSCVKVSLKFAFYFSLVSKLRGLALFLCLSQMLKTRKSCLKATLAENNFR